jgi:glutamate--cysteine ligase
MSIPQIGGGPIESRSQLVEFFESGNKPKKDWRIGTEHEKFGYRLLDLSPLPYEGDHGIRAMLEGLARFGWDPVLEGDNIIGLTQDGASVSLEPGGQLELSGAPLETLHQTCSEVHTHLDQVERVAHELDVGFIGLGFTPNWTLEETHVMPKGRYNIMKRYMPRMGVHGLDMMFRTCTVQVNLDFSSEVDMVKKMRVGLALQPIATALFANSPFTEGKPNGYRSFRSQVWLDTDPDRTGMLPFAFEDGFGFERYVDYALDVPMYFVYRNGRYVDASGKSFRSFLEGKLDNLPGETPTMSDWADHLTTIFPEVRTKQFIEMRGADGGPWRGLCALPAFWVGLLYDQTSLDAAWDLVSDWTTEERDALRHGAPKTGLATPFRNRTIQTVAIEALKISRAGLEARGFVDHTGDLESQFLEALFEIAESGRTQADELLEAYNGPWNGDVNRVYAEYSY